MNLKEFINKWDWKVVDYDGYYKYQCKDYSNQYTKEVFNYESPKWNAYEVFFADWWDKWEKFKNTPDFLPKEGDICIWKIWEYWHIGIVLSADLQTMIISDQNTWSGNWDWIWDNKIRTHQYSYKNVYWFIRYKVQNKPSEEFYIKNGIKIPKQINGIPIRLVNRETKNTIAYASIKWLIPKFKKDEIVIYNNAFRKYPTQELFGKLCFHEWSHIVYYKYLNENQRKAWERISRSMKEYISTYASTNVSEDFAEVLAWIDYKERIWSLPKNKKYNQVIEDKYYFAKKLYDYWMKKCLKIN